MTRPHSTVHQIVGKEGKPSTATGCFNPWIGKGPDVFAMPREGNAVKPLVTGEAYYADLIKEVDAAQSEVQILGWQVAWDALLAPGVRLYDLLHRNAKRGVKFYVMPWDDTNPVQTYDDQTRIIFEDINRRLGLTGDKKAIHVLLSSSFASVNGSYFSHHQKCVVVDLWPIRQCGVHASTRCGRACGIEPLQSVHRLDETAQRNRCGRSRPDVRHGR